MRNGLVNGLSGTVKIKVKIEEIENIGHSLLGQEFYIDPCVFIMRDNKNVVMSVREQMPVKLGYAIIVNKAQGRSIKHMKVDAYNFWHPRQFGVAVGRSMSKDG